MQSSNSPHWTLATLVDTNSITVPLRNYQSDVFCMEARKTLYIKVRFEIADSVDQPLARAPWLQVSECPVPATIAANGLVISWYRKKH